MKFLLLIFTVFFTSSNSQELTAPQIHQISEHEFDHLDQLMISEHGFVRIKNIEHENQRVYSNDSPHLDQLMVITIIKNTNSCANVISIVNRSAESVSKFKKELLQNGYENLGKKKMSEELIINHFIKGKINILVSDTVTSTGAYQILLICK